MVLCGGHRTPFPLLCPCKSGPVACVAAAAGSLASRGDVLAKTLNSWSAAVQDKQGRAVSPCGANAWQGEHQCPFRASGGSPLASSLPVGQDLGRSDSAVRVSQQSPAGTERAPNH